ncbi:Lrp/AsnC family transcriptional regulator [Paenarthrobacter sp. DKR-5]|uniref:Lrp/AsnC family transcriptional regulator n=1 Tax=Paenarthrobacter sp. DKR-5 TaxID=2835535 RepID=UPI001BDC1178|nr:Lrp/AsnC family transcriptional regulator [Paenarthrobacter sp. DKR-5]MBT1003524.1 Lrp/AsnC family transcriptional regulator [Paenarthrobacter sp. DKR-5]
MTAEPALEAEDASVITDPVDLDIVAALQVAPRVPATTLAEILEQPTTTVTRKLKRLQRDRVVKVIGRFAWPLITSGNPLQMWIRCQPGRSYEVAERMKEFPEIQFLLVTSGSADIYADLFPLVGSDANDLISRRIPSIPGIASAQSQLVLKSPRVGQSWRLNRLTEQQHNALEGYADQVVLPAISRIDDLNDIDFRTLLELGHNARISAAELARKLSVSSSTAYRSMQTILGSGAISPRVEVEPGAVGFPLNAIISLQVDPSAIPAVLTDLSQHPSARMVSMVAGSTSVIHNGVFAGPSELADFITEDIGALAGVHSMDICVGMSVLRRYWMDRDGLRIGDQVRGLLKPRG